MKTDSRVEQIFYKSGSKGDMLPGIWAILYYTKVEDRWQKMAQNYKGRPRRSWKGDLDVGTGIMFPPNSDRNNNRLYSQQTWNEQHTGDQFRPLLHRSSTASRPIWVDAHP